MGRSRSWWRAPKTKFALGLLGLSVVYHILLRFFVGFTFAPEDTVQRFGVRVQAQLQPSNQRIPRDREARENVPGRRVELAVPSGPDRPEAPQVAPDPAKQAKRKEEEEEEEEEEILILDLDDDAVEEERPHGQQTHEEGDPAELVNRDKQAHTMTSFELEEHAPSTTDSLEAPPKEEFTNLLDLVHLSDHRQSAIEHERRERGESAPQLRAHNAETEDAPAANELEAEARAHAALLEPNDYQDPETPDPELANKRSQSVFSVPEEAMKAIDGERERIAHEREFETTTEGTEDTGDALGDDTADDNAADDDTSDSDDDEEEQVVNTGALDSSDGDDGDGDDDDDDDGDDDVDQMAAEGDEGRAPAPDNLHMLLMHTTTNGDGSETPFLGEDEDINDVHSIACKNVPTKAACAEIPQCFWGSDTRSCRTQVWAMTCDMTRVKRTCLKIKSCEWASRLRSKGRFCKEREDEPDDDDEEDDDDDDGDADNSEEEEEEEEEEGDSGNDEVPCKTLVEAESCTSNARCTWNDAKRLCRTQPWALTCSMTQLKSKCKKIEGCGWTSRSRKRGKYCKERPAGSEDDEAAAEDGGESAQVAKPRPKCKKQGSKGKCEEKEHCYWSEDGSGCKTELSAMTCSMTQLRSTCLSIPNCTWAAPTSKRTKGRYCQQPDDASADVSAVESELPETAAEDNALSQTHATVRIGNRTVSLFRCKTLTNQMQCLKHRHCEFGANGCRTSDRFLPCKATALKSKCEAIPHCLWSAKTKTRGKFCFDKYFLDNPDELETKCTKIKTVESCDAQVACEWRSTTKTKGRFCERQVSLSKAQEELLRVFTNPRAGLYPEHADTEVTRFALEEDPLSKEDRIGCPRNLECQHPDALAALVGVEKRRLLRQTMYNQHTCCQLHADYTRMLEAITKHFDETHFEDWWVDKEFLIGMYRFRGAMPPWMRTAAISVVAKSSRTVRTLMDSFNQGFRYRPFSVRACGLSSKGGVTCKALQKFSSKRKLLYYTISHMDIEDGPELHIYQRIISSGDKRCVFLTDGKPVPLAMVSPTSRCPYTLHGSNVRCPREFKAYLDLKYGPTWRKNTFIRQQTPAPDWESEEAKTVQADAVTASSPFHTKLFWLRRHHCPTP